MKNEVYAEVAVKDIDILTKIIEAYEHLGIVSTVDQSQGIVVVRGTPDTMPEILKILKTLPFPVKIIED